MCGGFTQRYTWREIADLYGLTGAARTGLDLAILAEENKDPQHNQTACAVAVHLCPVWSDLVVCANLCLHQYSVFWIYWSAVHPK